MSWSCCKLLVAAALPAVGCVGTIDGTLALPDAGDASLAEPAPAFPADADDGSTQDGAAELDASLEHDAAEASTAELRVGHSARFDDYLMDRAGAALYMFAGDVAGAGESACADDCAREWPPFDLNDGSRDAQIPVATLTRFHREDGRWQTAFKGHPLYYRADSVDSREVTRDGHAGLWYVARDYLAFVAVSRSFSPAGSTGFNAPYLTDALGRTLYACLDDTPGDARRAPVSTCVGECALRRPVWSVNASDRAQPLPSTLDASDIDTWERPDGATQLLLRGWPLYYFSGDQSFGDTQGQNQDAWRAIDPSHFARAP